jgi:hypothetical protein
MAGLARSGHSRTELGLVWALPGGSWVHQIAISTEPQPALLSESLKKVDSDSSAFDATYHLDGRGEASLAGLPPRFIESDNHSLLPAARNLSAHAFGGLPAAPVFLFNALVTSVLLNVTPERMRGYAQKQVAAFGAEGENISPLLWKLCREEESRREWVDWLSEFCAPEIQDIDFIETELGDVMLVLVEKDGTRTPARSLSDGTLRFLGMLVALRTALPGSIIMLEEPETGLHPQRIHLLVEYLEAVTRERGIQVIATTHSPQLLQTLSSEALQSAVLCARSPDHPGTVLRRLGDLSYKEVFARSRIDHLFTTGWLERAL